MNRVEAIEKYAQRKEKEEIRKKNATMDRVEAYKARVRGLQPRITELIEVGNAVAFGNTKAECQADARRYVASQNQKNM